MRTIRIPAMIMVIAALACVSPLFAVDLDVRAVLERIDNLMTFDDSDFSSLMTFVSEDPEQGVERQVVRQYRRDSSDRFLMLISEPSLQRGQGYLREGDNLWFYDPESRKFSHTSLKEAFGGTDARNSDFGESSLVEDYLVREVSEGTLGRYAIYVLDLEASHNEVTYPFRKIWVTRDNYLVLKTEDYSLTERLLRTSYFPSYARAGQTVIPTKMIFVDELVEGRKTQITMSEISVADIPDSVFTKSYVERASR